MIRGCLLLIALLWVVPAHAADTVRIFNWTDYIAPTTLADFTQATGIATSYDMFDDNAVLEARLLAGNSGFDLVVPSATPYFARHIQAGLYLPLDKSAIPNWSEQDPVLLAKIAAIDPNNQHGAIYQWGTNGIGYNRAMISKRVADAPLNSWRLIFDPNLVKNFADCGVAMLDSASEVIPLVLLYLGLPPDSQDAAHLAAAAAHMQKLRPYIRYFHSSNYLNDLAAGNICLALGWSGDVAQAAARANEAGNGHEIIYSLPSEGSMLWFDMLAIPNDAPNPAAAHRLINFLLDPVQMGNISRHTKYANAVPNSWGRIDRKSLSNKNLWPDAELRQKLFLAPSVSQAYERSRGRAWSRIKAAAK